MKLRLLIFTLLCSVVSWGQTTLPVSRTVWTGAEPLGWSQTGTTDRTTISACTGNDASIFDTTGDVTTVFFSGIPQTLTFKLKKQGLSGTVSKMTVEESIDGLVWTLIGNYGAAAPQTIITDCADISVSLVSTSRYVRWTYTKGTGNCDLDDVNITALGGTPTVSVTPSTLTGFTYLVGSGPSATQTFTVSGINLTADIVLTAPTNYEISNLPGGPYFTTMNYTPAAGSVAPTTIYVRLKAGLPVGTYNTENISVTSTGATSQNVTCSGTVTGSALSDVIAVGASESASISSTINDAAPLNSTTGVQVWQFKVRDGGAALSDGDNLPTILTAFTLAQSAGNQVSTWTDAINTVALFDGSTFIATGTVTANQIQFTGLNVNVADNTEKTLSLRLSLKCPLGADAFDNEDFGFSLSNANTTFSTSGSGKTAFAAQTSANGSNLINVVATKLTFTTQPVTTGVNNTMANVVVSATDACGNIDLNFTGNISITSTGTMTGSPIIVAATSGVSNYATIIHTVIGTGLTLNATSVGLTSDTSTLFDITFVTAFTPGDFAVIALNSNITCFPAGPNGVYSAGDDEISFITFKDIQNGDTFSITDNGYERTTANLWGDQEGVYTITRTGGTILAGTVITIRLRNVAPLAEFVSPDTAWTVAKAAGFPTGSLVMNSGGDQIFFMQGGSWSNPAGTADAVYTPGVYLYAFNTNSAWNSLMNSTQHSGLPIDLRCFSLMPGSATDFLEYTGPITPAAKLDWIARLNNPANWTNRVNCAGYTSMHVGQSYSVITGGTFVDGVWTGAKNTDWFECSNWQTLKVPDQTVNVDINATYAQRNAVIDIVANASNAAIYGNVAESNNISITDKVLQIEGNSNNRLDVYGNLIIDGTGSVDMDDTTPTTDGTINLYGNWTNNIGNAAFSEGNGTVNFTGSIPQIINNVTPEGTESFANVILNNNFNTSVSNDIIANGNLTVNAAKTLTITSNDFVQVQNNVTNNGTLNILNNGSLVQIDDTGTNTGNINMERIANIRLQDYVYWSAPTSSAAGVANFPITSVSPSTPTSVLWKWDPVGVNLNGGLGMWINTTENMIKGKGYIVRGPSGTSNSTTTPLNVNFIGVPNNGVIPFTIQRGNDLNAGTPGPNGVMRTIKDDNHNLIGNPYPSAIDADLFIDTYGNPANPAFYADIEGSVRIWSHNTLPSSSIVDPFYADYQSNYTANDYIIYNSLGSQTGPATFNGKIAAGQGFFVVMNDGAAGTNTINFKNSLRSRTFNNSQFFRTNSNVLQSANGIEKHRIWLDLVSSNNSVVRTLIGYANGATNQKDNVFDAITDSKNSYNLYSVLDNEVLTIQGRTLPFNVEDKVQLGVAAPTSGTYKIAIAAADGIFSNITGNQKVYLEDKELNIIHDLTSSPYQFTIAQGKNNSRFVLRYTENALSNELITFNENDINIYSDDQIHISSKNVNIQNVNVYDALGRLIFENKEVNKNNLNIAIMENKIPLIVKIVLENGAIMYKKIIH